MNNTKLEKIEWIKKYLSEKQSLIDILNAEFVDDYINEFHPHYIPMSFGANKVPELGKILSFGYSMGIFERSRIGLYAHEVGFPNWIYCYELNNHNK